MTTADFELKLKTETFDAIVSAAAALATGDMQSATYDAANINQQVLGTTATQTVTNKTMGSGCVWNGTDVAVADGGTGVSSLTGMVKGNGTSAFSAATEGTDYYGPGSTDVALADGGTGASTAQSAMANLKGVYILGASAVASSVTGTLTETSLGTVTVPANAMGANGIVRISTVWSFTNSANNKILKQKFGGTAYESTTATTTGTFKDMRWVQNRNATNSQVGGTSTATGGGWGLQSATAITSSIDTTSSVSITFTGTLANTGETITLESYLIELMVP